MNDAAQACPAGRAGPMHCLHTERLVLEQRNPRSRRLLERLGFVRAPDAVAAARRQEPGEMPMVEPAAA